jgi:hypothetical protein
MSDAGVDQQSLRKDAYTSLYFPQQHQVAVSGVKDVVRHGWLTKQGGRISTWKRRWCVLSAATGTLYYYKTQRDAKPAGFIPLDDCVVRRGGSKRPFAFEIAHTQRRVFSLFADTEPDLYSWLAAIEHLIAALRDKALRDRDAVWLDLVRPSLLHSLSTPSSARSSPRGSVHLPPAGDAASARLRSASFESRPAVVLRTRSASVDQDSSSGDGDNDDNNDDDDDDDDDSEATTEEINGEAAADDDDNNDDDDDADDKKNKKKKKQQQLESSEKKSRPQKTPSSDAPRRAASLLGRSQSSRKFTTLKEASLSDAQQRRSISDRPTDLAALNETTMSTGIVSWRVLSALLGARALSAAHADALRFVLFATVLPTTKWLDKPQAPLDACSDEDLAFVTREQLNFFVHVFGPHDKWLSWCVPLSKCYHGAISAARAKTLLEGALVGSFLLRLTPAALPPITPAETLHMIESEQLRPEDMPDWPEPPLLVFHCRTLEGIRELPVRREPNTLYHYLPGDTIWADLGALLKNTPAFVAPFAAPLVLWQERFAKADAELRSGANNRTISVGGDIVTRRRVKSRKLSPERDHRSVGPVDLSASAGDAPTDHPTSPRRVTVADQLKIAVARRLTTIRRAKVDAGADETPSAAPEVQLSPRRRLVQAQLELVMREKEKMEEQLAAKKLAEQATHQELLAAAAQCPLTPAQVAHWLRERHVRAERAAQLLADERRVEIECAVARVEIAIAELRVVVAETPGAIAPTTHSAVVELRLRRDELRRWVNEDDDDQTTALLASDDFDKELHSRAKAALHKVSGEATTRHLWRVVPLEKVTALLESGTAYDEDFSMSGSSLVKQLASANKNYARVLEIELRRTLTNESDSAFLESHQRGPAATIVAETCGRVRFVGEVCDAQVLARLQAL